MAPKETRRHRSFFFFHRFLLDIMVNRWVIFALRPFNHSVPPSGLRCPCPAWNGYHRKIEWARNGQLLLVNLSDGTRRRRFFLRRKFIIERHTCNTFQFQITHLDYLGHEMFLIWKRKKRSTCGTLINFFLIKKSLRGKRNTLSRHWLQLNSLFVAWRLLVIRRSNSTRRDLNRRHVPV